MLNLKQDWILRLKKGRNKIFDFDKSSKIFLDYKFSDWIFRFLFCHTSKRIQ